VARSSCAWMVRHLEAITTASVHEFTSGIEEAINSASRLVRLARIWTSLAVFTCSQSEVEKPLEFVCRLPRRRAPAAIARCGCFGKALRWQMWTGHRSIRTALMARACR